ncbi:hypothetical protein TomTYG75_06700 [Sphingobium sp. TomTYG75]
MSEELVCRDCGLPKANATELCDTFVRSDELGAPQPASPPAKPAPADALALLKCWVEWSCGQQGQSPFHDTRAFLSTAQGEGA